MLWTSLETDGQMGEVGGGIISFRVSGELNSFLILLYHPPPNHGPDKKPMVESSNITHALLLLSLISNEFLEPSVRVQ